jgi:hypothetical protein
MKKSQINGSTVLVLLLFAVFAVCVLSVLLTGAGAYSRLTQRDQGSYTHRTVAQYLATRLRQGDENGALWVGDFAGDRPLEEGDTLFFTQEIDGETYDTRVYAYEGSLRELFALRDGTFSPADGQEILPAQDLTVTRSGSLLTLTVTDADGSPTTLYLHQRSGEVAE